MDSPARRRGFDDGPLLALLRAIASQRHSEVARLLDSSPGLATAAIQIGASRQGPDGYFLDAIRHHVYRGDTALHIAAAAHQRPAAESLVARGVAPLHRAVRTRSSAAVRALIEGGADPRLMNKSGSTPLHLAVQNTGRSDSGSDAAKDEQSRVIAVLLECGASPTDTDGHGKTVAAAASSEWIRRLLDSGPDR